MSSIRGIQSLIIALIKPNTGVWAVLEASVSHLGLQQTISSAFFYPESNEYKPCVTLPDGPSEEVP